MSRGLELKLLTDVTIRNITKTKEKLKNCLPVLSSEEIRRHRIPYHEAILLELQEEGATEAREYFQFLFDLDAEMRRAAGPGTVIWNKPKLMDNKELVDRLRVILTTFFATTIPKDERTRRTLAAALEIEALTWEWWWIAETLFRAVFWLAREIEGEPLCLLRYLYARFLFVKMGSLKLAAKQVAKARETARNQPWRADAFLGPGQESLFRESCALQHQILMEIAREAREIDINLAVESCKLAVEAVTESGHCHHVSEAQLELGLSEKAAGNIREAINHFHKSLSIRERIGDPQGICTCHQELAFAYKTVGDHYEVLLHYQKFKETASNFELQNRLADAHYLVGEYYLSQDNHNEATTNLEISFRLYNKLKAKDMANRARCLIGVSKGQEMMEAYRDLIKRNVAGEAHTLLKIIRWKDRLEPFDKKTISVKEGKVLEKPEK